MAQPGSPWDGLTQAHSEKVIAAVALVLRANATLAALFGTAGDRIIISPDPLLHLDLPVPTCVVSPLAQTNVLRLGGELGKTHTVRIFILYEELRRSIGVTDKTVKAALSLIETALLNNDALQVAEFGNAELAERIDRIAALDFGAVGEGANIKRIQTLEVDYQYRVEAWTGQP